MNTISSNFFVITGGPGVGKTTLIKELQRLGVQTMEEDARKIIKEQLANQSDALPWKNKTLYASLMYAAAVKSYNRLRAENKDSITFFDRGIIDTIGYMKMEGIPITAALLQESKKYSYNKHVFILPPWKEIYTTDSERKQDWKTAILTFEYMNETYQTFGYKIIVVPKTSLQERTAFILNHIKKI